MGYIFDIDDETVWSPSLRAGALYVDLAEAMARSMKRPTGLSTVAEDMYDIDLPTFNDFTAALLEEYFSADHVVVREMLRGVLLTSLVILQRGGVRLAPGIEEQERLWSALPDFALSMPHEAWPWPWLWFRP